MPPLVSILIPCYNAARWLGETLESALAQTWPRCEIILVDDGSTDESLQLARRFETRGVRVLMQANAGAAAARNTAFYAASGQFIQFLDADDLLAPHKIERQLARAATAPVGAVLTGRWGRFRDDPALAEFADANPLFADASPRDYFLRYASHDCMMHPAAWLLPRALAETVGPWDEQLSLNDDGEYFSRVVSAASHIAFCADAVSHYRSALPTSLSAQRSRRHLESAHRALVLITTRMLTLENSPRMRRAAADLCQRFAYDYYPAGADLVANALARARQHGGSAQLPLGGRGFQLVSRLLGWRAARRLQIAAGKFAAPGSN